MHGKITKERLEEYDKIQDERDHLTNRLAQEIRALQDRLEIEAIVVIAIHDKCKGLSHVDVGGYRSPPEESIDRKGLMYYYALNARMMMSEMWAMILWLSSGVSAGFGVYQPTCPDCTHEEDDDAPKPN